MRSFHETLRSAGLSVPSWLPNEDGVDARWRALTEAGNRAFADHDDTAALHFYETALSEAERIFDMALEGGPPLLAPMVYNISSVNIAEAKLRMGNRVEAFAFLSGAVDKLVTVAASPATPIALRANCVRHVRYALAILSRDFDEDQEGSDVKTLLARVAVVASEVGRIAGWMVSQRDRRESREHADPLLPAWGPN